MGGLPFGECLVESLGRALVRAEDRLRAVGLTGAQAFDALAAAVEERLGRTAEVTPEARALAAELPLDGEPLGLAYERFFADLFKGRRGQFFTPPPIVRLLVGRLGIAAGERVLDPTCGSGSLLVEALRSGARVRGIERDPRLARLARLHLELAGAEPDVRAADFFLAEAEPVDVVVANPPFSVAIDEPAILARYELGRGRRRAVSDVLFVEAIERWVRPGGRAGLVLPYGVLTNRRLAALRERIEQHWRRIAICALPEGVFRPFGGAAGRAILLWLERRGAEGRDARCRWGTITDPGYDPRRQQLRLTSNHEIDRLLGGEGWIDLPDGAWAPATEGEGRRVRSFAKLSEDRIRPSGAVRRADLADTDRSIGELLAVPADGAALAGQRQPIVPGDVLVARLRPGLGNVVVAGEAAVGSPEWIVLHPERLSHWLLHTLRTPTWRAGLPVTAGQTRPRTTAETVLDSAVAWPGEEVAQAIDALSSRLFAERARLRHQLQRLQDAVDRFAAGELDADGLRREITAIGSG